MDSTDEMVVVPIADLERVGVAAYVDVGASPDDARFLFRTNLDKAIQGDNARGLVKVPGLIAQARRGDLDVAPNIQVLRDRPGTAIVDGGTKASGRLVSCAAMTLAIEKARSTGIAMVSWRGGSGELLTGVRPAGDRRRDDRHGDGGGACPPSLRTAGEARCSVTRRSPSESLRAGSIR